MNEQSGKVSVTVSGEPSKVPKTQPCSPSRSEPQPEIEKISMKLPEFWEDAPDVWFAQAEAEFEISKIIRERTKYSYLLGALPKQILVKVIDVLKKPDVDNPYTSLKHHILNRVTQSEEARLTKLLYHVEIGDRTPSDLFRHMVQLAGDSSMVGSALIQKLWKSRLPKAIETALIAVDTKEQEEQLRIADRLWECAQVGMVAEVKNKSESDYDTQNITSEIRAEIRELREAIKKLTFQERGRSPSRSQSGRARQRSKSARSTSQSRMCWYHFRFGKDAEKCVAPCTFSKNNKKN